MKKLDIQGMSKKSKLIVLSTVITMVVGVGGYLVYNSFNSGADPLTSKLGVKDATEKNGGLQSPYKVSKESFDKAVKEDKYLSEKYSISDSITEEVSNVDNRDTFKVKREYSLTGTDKEGGSGKENYTRDFYSNIKTYDKFNNPSSLTLVYGYKDESEAKDVTDSSKRIISKLFNSDVAEFVFSQGDEAYVKDIKSKSGKYNLKVSKGTVSIAGHKQVNITIDFDTSEQTSYDLDSFKYEDGIEPLYAKLPMFDGIAIKDMPAKYSDIIGDYSTSRLTLLLNKVDKTNEYRKQTSAFTIRTIYKDNSATAVEYTISETEDNDGKINKAALNVNTSVRYGTSVNGTMIEAAKIVSGILGEKVQESSSSDKDEEVSSDGFRLTAEERKSGSATRELTKNICGYDFKITVEIKTETDANGTYGVIAISGK